MSIHECVPTMIVHVIRETSRRLRELDVRAASLDAAVVGARSLLPGSSFTGPWTS